MLVELVLFAALVFLLWKSFRKPPGLPPGKWGLPLVGYIPLSKKTIEEHVADFHKQYGDIFVWRMGTQVMVFLNDFKLVREAFTKFDYADRPDWETFKLFEEPAVGIGSSNGALWHNNRRFTLRQLRDLGMGKSKLVEAIQKESVALRDAIAKTTGKPGKLHFQLYVSVINVIWQMVASKMFDAEDKELREFVKIMNDFVIVSNRLAFKDFMPWLQKVMPDFLLKYLTRHKEMMAMKEKLFGYFYKEIDGHRASLDPNNPRDLIDNYLLEMEEKKDDPETTCSNEDLAFLAFDLFFAGSETTVTTFWWLCCYLAAYPQVQRKLQAEIDEVLPNGALPTLTEKARMTYMEATIDEVLRISALVNLGIQHMTRTETQLGGHTIPKGAVINTSVFSIQFDNRYWNRPLEFMPERWLDENGKISMKKDGFLPFGVGKRSCVGESLARMELFIFVTTVFQSFCIASPPGKTIDLTPDISGLFLRKPMFNEFVFSERK